MTDRSTDLEGLVLGVATTISALRPADKNAFIERLFATWPAALPEIERLAGEDAPQVAKDYVGRAARAFVQRNPDLKERERDLGTEWFEASSTVGYIAHIDQFGGELRSVVPWIPYLKELGITLLRLDGVLVEADRGVSVRPGAGENRELRSLARDLHEAGISVEMLVPGRVDIRSRDDLFAALDEAAMLVNQGIDSLVWPGAAESIVAPFIAAVAKSVVVRDEAGSDVASLALSAQAEKQARFVTEALRGAGHAARGAHALRGERILSWFVPDAAIESVGASASGHRAFLNKFYSGAFDGTWARGRMVQAGEVRGVEAALASLAGAERASRMGDVGLLREAAERMRGLAALLLALPGVPYLVAGDELGQLSAADGDDRSRPVLDEKLARLRGRDGSFEKRVFDDVRTLIAARGAIPALAEAPLEVLPIATNEAVLAVARRAESGDVVCLFNVSARPADFPASWLEGFALPRPIDALTGRDLRVDNGSIELPRYGVMWLVSE